jgi:hypothetical protein
MILLWHCPGIINVLFGVFLALLFIRLKDFYCLMILMANKQRRMMCSLVGVSWGMIIVGI